MPLDEYSAGVVAYTYTYAKSPDPIPYINKWMGIASIAALALSFTLPDKPLIAPSKSAVRLSFLNKAIHLRTVLDPFECWLQSKPACVQFNSMPLVVHLLNPCYKYYTACHNTACGCFVVARCRTMHSVTETKTSHNNAGSCSAVSSLPNLKLCHRTDDVTYYCRRLIRLDSLLGPSRS